MFTSIITPCSCTGGFINDHGEAVPEGQIRVFMVVNTCPNEWPNVKWCGQSPSTNNMNQFGYKAHFNLEDGAGQLTALGWKDKNPEVIFEWLSSCDDVDADVLTPSDVHYLSECQCGSSNSGK